jgi:hypothetical protein
MDQEREDTGQSQHDVDQIQGEPSGAGYPEEEPGGAGDEDTGGSSTGGRSGSDRGTPDGGSSEGESGEGSQSTGNPGAAG